MNISQRADKEFL
ncbi:hypothetical protein RDABS01_025716 [Bienertia sinuspersici]